MNRTGSVPGGSAAPGTSVSTGRMRAGDRGDHRPDRAAAKPLRLQVRRRTRSAAGATAGEWKACETGIPLDGRPWLRARSQTRWTASAGAGDDRLPWAVVPGDHHRFAGQQSDDGLRCGGTMPAIAPLPALACGHDASACRRRAEQARLVRRARPVQRGQLAEAVPGRADGLDAEQVQHPQPGDRGGDDPGLGVLGGDQVGVRAASAGRDRARRRRRTAAAAPRRRARRPAPWPGKRNPIRGGRPEVPRKTPRAASSTDRAPFVEQRRQRGEALPRVLGVDRPRRPARSGRSSSSPLAGWPRGHRARRRTAGRTGRPAARSGPAGSAKFSASHEQQFDILPGPGQRIDRRSEPGVRRRLGVPRARHAR